MQEPIFVYVEIIDCQCHIIVMGSDMIWNWNNGLFRIVRGLFSDCLSF